MLANNQQVSRGEDEGGAGEMGEGGAPHHQEGVEATQLQVGLKAGQPVEALEEVTHDGVLQVALSPVLVVQDPNRDTFELDKVRAEPGNGLELLQLQRLLPSKAELLKRGPQPIKMRGRKDRAESSKYQGCEATGKFGQPGQVDEKRIKAGLDHRSGLILVEFRPGGHWGEDEVAGDAEASKLEATEASGEGGGQGIKLTRWE